MAITINGSGTITGVSAGGLPDGCVTADDLATTLDLSSNTITLPSGTGGKVLQVVTDTLTTMITASANTRTEVLSASITPSSTSSKILIQYHITGAHRDNELLTYLQRGGTDIFNYTGTDITGTERKATVGGGGVNVNFAVLTMSAVYLDSPSTTSATTYSVEALQDYYTLRINRSDGTGTGDSTGSTCSLVLMEIGA